ncbi:MAG: HIT family protein [Acidimicrobiales bacterium]
MTMDRLWAGWRSDYIDDVSAAAPDTDVGSVFTRILASGLADEETHVVWRGEHTFAILNRYPYTSGHVLVMPYRQGGDLEGLSEAEHTELFAAVVAAVTAVKSAYSPQGINVGFNLGEAAGAGVPDHLHCHVLPRWSADSNFMTAVAETRVLPESLDRTWQRLTAAWPR